MTKYYTLIHTYQPFCLVLKLLSGDRPQILRDTSNGSSNTHKIAIDSPCNGGYPQIAGYCGLSITKWHTFLHILLCIFIFSDMASCICRP